MVGLGFRFQQFLTADFAFGVFLASAGFFFVGNAAGHGAGRYEYGWQMAETECADQQSRNNFVAKPIAVAIAMTSRLNNDNSMPA